MITLYFSEESQKNNGIEKMKMLRTEQFGTTHDSIILTLGGKWKGKFDNTIDYEETEKINNLASWNFSKCCEFM